MLAWSSSVAASVISGRLVTRWGRYRIFPILGTAMMTLGAYLLSLIDASINSWVRPCGTA